MSNTHDDTQFGGKHPITATLTNILAKQGVKAPHTGRAFTEAMLFGIGGGLGIGYILWEFKQDESTHIVLGFRNRWNYPVQYLTHLCERISVPFTVQETSGQKVALANLQTALAAGQPVIAWVDKAHLPYQQLPEALKGYVSHVVGVHSFDEGRQVVQVDDLADGLFRVPMEIFAAARNRIVSDKNRLMRVEPTLEINLEAAILAGLQECLEHLGSNSDSFALPVIKKWARLMTDTKNKKGWPVVFKERKGLYNSLHSIFEGIVLDGTEGSGLRGLYADFLNEASPIVGKSALKDVAAQYRQVAAQWSQLAETALPDSMDVFQETRALLVKRYALLKRQDLEAMRPVSDKLAALQAELNREFPLGEAEMMALFASLQEKLFAIYEAEMQALAALQSTVG